MIQRFYEFQLHNGFKSLKSFLNSKCKGTFFFPLNRKRSAGSSVHSLIQVLIRYVLYARLLGATDTVAPAETTFHFSSLSWLLPFPFLTHTCSADGAALTDERGCDSNWPVILLGGSNSK